MSFLPKLFTPSVPLPEYLIGLVLLLYPALLFLVQGAMNGSLFLLVILSIWFIVAHRNDHALYFDRTGILFAVAMSSGLLVILASQLYHDDLSGRYFDSSARFLLAIPVLLALRQVNLKILNFVQYVFPIGAISALAAVMAVNPSVRSSASISYMNHIHLGDLALLLGFLSVLSIDWVKKDGIALKLLKISGLIAGMIVSIFSSARGGWIAVPMFVGVYIYFGISKIYFKNTGITFLVIALTSLLAYLFIDPIHQRLWMIYSDLSAFSGGHTDTSIGIRLQLWGAALHLIAENPLLGVGADGFGQAMDSLSASGFITPVAAKMGKGEVHNEILAQTVRFGVLGLFSILAVYFVPFYLFVRAAKAGNQQQAGAAMLGMCVTLGFFIFGLTVETFNLKMTAAFYALTVAVLLAMATHQGNSDPENRGQHA